MYHSFLIHSSADGHLGSFYVLAIINSAAMNIGVHVSLSILISFRMDWLDLLAVQEILKSLLYITALFIIARTWKKPRCPSADEWIRKLWYMYTMKYYSAIEKNAFKSVLMR